MFEPLDALYTAMYGAKPGYNVPSDISTYWNGTERWVYIHTMNFCLGGLSEPVICL